MKLCLKRPKMIFRIDGRKEKDRKKQQYPRWKQRCGFFNDINQEKNRQPVNDKINRLMRDDVPTVKLVKRISYEFSRQNPVFVMLREELSERRIMQ